MKTAKKLDTTVPGWDTSYVYELSEPYRGSCYVAILPECDPSTDGAATQAVPCSRGGMFQGSCWPIATGRTDADVLRAIGYRVGPFVRQLEFDFDA